MSFVEKTYNKEYLQGFDYFWSPGRYSHGQLLDNIVLPKLTIDCGTATQMNSLSQKQNMRKIPTEAYSGLLTESNIPECNCAQETGPTHRNISLSKRHANLSNSRFLTTAIRNVIHRADNTPSKIIQDAVYTEIGGIVAKFSLVELNDYLKNIF